MHLPFQALRAEGEDGPDQVSDEIKQSALYRYSDEWRA